MRAEERNPCWSVWGDLPGEVTFELGHKRWARSYGVEDIPCRELHEQSMSTCECRKHLEVSDPAHTPSGREYSWDAVSLEDLYASESASSSSPEALPEPPQEDKQKTWAWASLHPRSQTVALFRLFIFEVFTLTFHLKNEFYFFKNKMFSNHSFLTVGGQRRLKQYS